MVKIKNNSELSGSQSNRIINLFQETLENVIILILQLQFQHTMKI